MPGPAAPSATDTRSRAGSQDSSGTGFLGRRKTPSARASRWSLALILVVLVGFFMLRASPSEGAAGLGQQAAPQAAVSGGRLITLVWPGLFAPLQTSEAALPGGNLPARGLLGTWLPEHAFYVGWLPLMFALLVVFDLGLRGRRGATGFWILRGLLLAGVAGMILGPGTLNTGAEILVACTLIVMAAFGLLSLNLNPQRLGPAMWLSIVALILSTAQILWSLSAGAGTDAAALRPWLTLLDESTRAQVLGAPGLAALNAEHLTSILDQAALTGFVSLCALLWFLKRRDGWASAGLILVIAGDFAWHHSTLT